MPVSIETQANLDARRACVAQLYGLGLSQAQVDEELGVHSGTSWNDIRRLKLPAHEKRSASDRFERMFERFAVFSAIADVSHDQRKVVADSHHGPYALVQLAIILENALELPSVWSRLGEEEALYKKMMSAGRHEPLWCYKLLETVFGPRHLVHDLYETRRTYLADVARGRASVPESTDAVFEALSARLANAARENMWPDWPEPECVEAMVRSALALLEDREVNVIERRYRDGEAIDSIARGHAVSRERIRQIEAQVLRKLRHPSRRETLNPLWEPVPLSWDATVGARARLEIIEHGIEALFTAHVKRAVIAGLSEGVDADTVDALCRTVDEFELSVRSAICLQNANIKFVWELVVKTEEDLLRNKNFGRSSLRDVKGALAQVPAGGTPLTLGMSPSDPNIVAAKKHRPRD